MAKLYNGPQFADSRLNPRYWLNRDKAQDHYFVSKIHLTNYAFLAPKFPEKIVAKPGKITMIPHGFYTITTRDDTPCKGTWVIGKFIEDYSEKSLHDGT